MARKQLLANLILSACIPLHDSLRADCLDGQLVQGQVSGIVSTYHAALGCGDSFIVDAPGSYESSQQCFLSDPKFGTVGVIAELEITTDTITALCRVAEIPESIAEGTVAWVQAEARFVLQGGAMYVTMSGYNEYWIEGKLYHEPFASEGPVGRGTDFPVGCQCGVLGAVGDKTTTCSATITAVPTVISEGRYWRDAVGGSYHDPNRWNTDCAPAYDPPQRRDNAIFNVPSASFLPITGSGATANIWALYNGTRVDFSGSAEVFYTLPTVPSLQLIAGAELRLSNHSTMKSADTRIDAALPGAPDSRMELVGDSNWTNSGRIQVGRGTLEVRSESDASTEGLQIGVISPGGAGGGSGTVRVDHSGTFQVNQQLELGVTQSGTLEVLEGSSFTLLDPSAPNVLVGSGAPGTILVRGDDSSFDTFGVLRLAPKVILGSGANASLRVERGGEAQIGSLDVGSIALLGTAEVVVDGQGGHASLEVDDTISVEGMEIAEVLVQGGGTMLAEVLHIGSGASSNGQLADVTIRGRGDAPALLPSKLSIVDPAGGTLAVDVGFAGPGLLNIQAGAEAEFDGGLRVGLSANGIVVVTGENAPEGTSSKLTVTGETQVGVGADGHLQVEQGGRAVCNGGLKIGLAAGLSTDAQVSVEGVSLLDVNGALHVGANGGGILDLKPGGIVECDTLVVGPDNAEGIGFVTLELVTFLAVSGNAHIGAAPGSVGSVFLSETGATLSIGGTMSIGSPSGGAGGGEVKLVDADIIGPGTIIVNPNGKLVGTGTVAVTKVNNGGTVSPGLSPGTLTIDGDYEQLAGGKLVMEFAGTAPGEFDVLRVTGEAALGGRLEVHFRGAFSPSDPHEFIHSEFFVAADQGVVGDFDGRFYAFPDQFADFDEDGDKDLSDVAAFQNCFGLSGSELEPACTRADWEGDGEISGREIRELSTRIAGPQ